MARSCSVHVASGARPARSGGPVGEERFAAYVAHELRTPLALQLALVEAALSDPDADAAAWRAMAKHVVASCEQQQHLIEALVDLALGRHGLTRRDPVDIAAITGHALRAHDSNAFQTTVRLEPARTTGDPVLVGRLAANLVSNAIRHNVTDGRIEIETGTVRQHAVLSVANTGRLIPPGELIHLFEPFQRFGPRRPVSGDGLGLGLAIVRAIADAHHTTITARARAGGGLRLDVRFPTTA